MRRCDHLRGMATDACLYPVSCCKLVNSRDLNENTPDLVCVSLGSVVRLDWRMLMMTAAANDLSIAMMSFVVAVCCDIAVEL